MPDENLSTKFSELRLNTQSSLWQKAESHSTTRSGVIPQVKDMRQPQRQSQAEQDAPAGYCPVPVANSHNEDDQCITDEVALQKLFRHNLLNKNHDIESNP